MRNYTSTVDATESINRAEALLVKAGATHIQKEYKDGKCTQLRFILDDPSGEPAAYLLPARAAAVQAKLEMDAKAKPRKRKVEAGQGERTAWKNLADWIDVHLSMIACQQVEASEVFMPYMLGAKSNITLYEAYKANPKLLNA